MIPEDLVSRVLYRDAAALIMDKPAGLMVHAGPSGGEHLQMYLSALRFGERRDPELAHRLDKETSGCLVLGRHKKALAQLGALFAQGLAAKTYWAMVVGRTRDTEGVMDFPLKKRERSHGWRMEVDRSGQASTTQWRLLGCDGRLSWLECKPLTGRTHQIRAHCAAMGHPLVGDAIYGRGTGTLAGDRLLLHSRHIELPLYPAKPPISATAPVPEHMRDYLVACGWAD
ncbi:RNA pseudouridine synthase [Paramagnetospirillum kuznetsovii]|uniref:RNA pseudouridine synthase n=1 Tax=Paramagnetospirillum kuznetsovii TaxID=2053833 RepID=A0A364NTF2_9PROT|nr:RNA pseudouridine synthase [Paramagnetospirillum kuznetsovii]RAU20369.1 RNA pseudouridine synthase [Paramagnetospirillum kuznetsovii]